MNLFYNIFSYAVAKISMAVFGRKLLAIVYRNINPINLQD